ncbi:MAG TPA: DUF559 domain-containing protein [Actinomycetospora sp.]|nr:DUF559 domain-containing protein [Actinomycetospora sp.]
MALWDAALNRSVVAFRDLAAARPLRAGRLAFDAVLRAVDARSESMPESFVRLALAGAGLRVEPQVLVRGVGFVDLLVERLVVVEIDGFAFHADRQAFDADRRRDRSAHAVGLRPLRYTYQDAVTDIAATVAEVVGVVQTLRRAGVPPVDSAFVNPTGSRFTPRRRR